MPTPRTAAELAHARAAMALVPSPRVSAPPSRQCADGPMRRCADGPNQLFASVVHCLAASHHQQQQKKAVQLPASASKQELQEQIHALQTQLAALTSDNSRMRQELTRIKFHTSSLERETNRLQAEEHVHEAKLDKERQLRKSMSQSLNASVDDMIERRTMGAEAAPPSHAPLARQTTANSGDFLAPIAETRSPARRPSFVPQLNLSRWYTPTPNSSQARQPSEAADTPADEGAMQEAARRALMGGPPVKMAQAGPPRAVPQLNLAKAAAVREEVVVREEAVSFTTRVYRKIRRTARSTTYALTFRGYRLGPGAGVLSLPLPSGGGLAGGVQRAPIKAPAGPHVTV